MTRRNCSVLIQVRDNISIFIFIRELSHEHQRAFGHEWCTLRRYNTDMVEKTLGKMSSVHHGLAMTRLLKGKKGWIDVYESMSEKTTRPSTFCNGEVCATAFDLEDSAIDNLRSARQQLNLPGKVNSRSCDVYFISFFLLVNLKGKPLQCVHALVFQNAFPHKSNMSYHRHPTGSSFVRYIRNVWPHFCR